MKLHFSLLIFIVVQLNAQVEPGYEKVLKIENDLKASFTRLFSMEDSQERDSLNKSIINTLSNELATWEGYYYPWNSLDNIGRAFSEDQDLKVFTWYLEKKEGDHVYFGILAHNVQKKRKRKEKNEFIVVELQDNTKNMRDPQILTLCPENWYGSLYYRVSSFEFRRKNWYVLYGYSFSGSFSQKKSLEIATIDDHGSIQFGGVIHAGEKVLKRLIFEYSNQVVMSVNYNSNLDMIVWDHLSPMEPIFHGNYRFYGPDGSYDALKFERGEFYLTEDVDARND